MSDYDKPPELYDGLRLHQNENTGGCSPRVLEALAVARADQIGFYPPYRTSLTRAPAYFGVEPDRLALTNGLDEGIMAIVVAYLRPLPGGTHARSDRPAAGLRDLRVQHVGRRRPAGAR